MKYFACRRAATHHSRGSRGASCCCFCCCAASCCCSCVQVQVVHQVPQLPPVLHPLCEVGCAATQLLCALPLHQVAPAGNAHKQRTALQEGSTNHPCKKTCQTAQSGTHTCQQHAAATTDLWRCLSITSLYDAMCCDAYMQYMQIHDNQQRSYLQGHNPTVDTRRRAGPHLNAMSRKYRLR
jgi:hypothetical protein